MGFTSEEVAKLLAAAGAAAEGRVTDLAGELNASREAVYGFLSILKEERVPTDQLAGKLQEIAQRHMEQMKSLAEPPPADIPQVRLEEAQTLLANASSTADYDEVDRLFAQAQSGFKIDAQVRSGSILVERGQLALTRLDYMKAGEHFFSAGKIFDNITPLSIPTLERARRSFIEAAENMDDPLGYVNALEVCRFTDRLIVADAYISSEARSASKHNLGALLSRVAEEERDVPRMQEAVDILNQALRMRSESENPIQWASTQRALGGALTVLGSEQDESLLEQAIAAFREALRIYSREANPQEWSETQERLGNALDKLGGGRKDVGLMQDATRAFRNALDVQTKDMNPLGWARLLIHVARVQERFNQTSYKMEAAEALWQALQYLTPENHLVHYTVANDQLSYVLYDLGQLESSVSHLKQARMALYAAWPYYQDDPATNALYTRREKDIDQALSRLS